MHKTFSKLRGIELHLFKGCVCGSDHRDYDNGDSGTEFSRYEKGDGAGYDGTILGYSGNGVSCKYDCDVEDRIPNVFYFLEDANA